MKSLERRLRIAQVSTVGTPVLPEGSDSVESLVWLLSRELTAMGHDVTVFAAGGSRVECKLVETMPGPYGVNGAPDDWHLCEWMNLSGAAARSGDFDVLHCHAYLWSIPLEPLSRAAMVHTCHVIPYADQARLRALWPRSCVTAITQFQWSGFPELPAAPIVPHGVDAGQFTFRAEPADYVCYMGRFIPQKGPLAAIRIAREAGMRILLAGPRNDYFNEKIAPLVDGKSVEYAGFVKGAARDALLGGARALLYPLEAPEPFGLVLVEAMMCGTPIAAIGLGAVGEIVDEGVTGHAAASELELVKGIPAVLALDRSAVRRRAVERFSVRRMAEDYLALYRRIAARGAMWRH